MTRLTESTVEDAAIAWLGSLGWVVKDGPDIAPGELFAGRSDYGELLRAWRLRDALACLNPDLPAKALKDAFRRLRHPEGADLIQRNRALHRMLVDEVSAGYRTSEGAISAAQARISDFDDRKNNDWLALSKNRARHSAEKARPVYQY